MIDYGAELLNFTNQGLEESFPLAGDRPAMLQVADLHETPEGLTIEPQVGVQLTPVALYAAFVAGETGKEVSFAFSDGLRITIPTGGQSVVAEENDRRVEAAVTSHDSAQADAGAYIWGRLTASYHNGRELTPEQVVKTGQCVLAILRAHQQLVNPEN